jgi:DNA replication ATP-dependent helicase Dna2
MLDRDIVIEAIEGELACQQKPLYFKVLERSREGQLWRVSVENIQGYSDLDESLEGAKAWWHEPQKGFGDVLAAIPEEQQIILRFASSDPPPSGETLTVYPICFLEPLKNAWDDLQWFQSIERFYDSITSPLSSGDTSDAITADDIMSFTFGWLREAQQKSFNLLSKPVGFLWGPPGTGKTTTLGTMLASYLLKFPSRKALLVSTTNVALDQALVAVDQALEKAQRLVPHASKIRQQIKRIGAHFRPEYYADRKHLLPVAAESIIEELIKHEGNQPDPTDTHAYAAWKDKKESLQRQLKERTVNVLNSSCLCAITSTRATFELSLLREFRPFDLLVFDEASQMSQAHALALCPLANKVLFAGDPKQLSPIVQFDHADVKEWLGKSMFEYMSDGAFGAVVLNEQSRMAEEICNVVSNTFYGGQLCVAKDKASDPAWLKERSLSQFRALMHVNITPIEGTSTWSQRFGGCIRYTSAEVAVQIVESILERGIEKTDLAVLTPFRAQRRLIKKLLRDNGITKILVSTVHRVQGSERLFVIFDPADGNSKFLQAESGKQLINVAISRAKACLILLLSESDRQNAIFRQIVNMTELSGIQEAPIPFEEIINKPSFPNDFVGKLVHFPGCTGKLIGLHGTSKIKVLDIVSGREKMFNLSSVREKITMHQEHIGEESPRKQDITAEGNDSRHDGNEDNILKLLSEEGRPMPLHEIAKSLELPVAQVKSALEELSIKEKVRNLREKGVTVWEATE